MKREILLAHQCVAIAPLHGIHGLQELAYGMHERTSIATPEGDPVPISVARAFFHNPAAGQSGVFFAFKVMRLTAVTSTFDEAADVRTYTVVGQVFFASADMFADSFDLRDTAASVLIDLGGAHFWDVTSVGALEGVVTKMRRHGTRVEILGLNQTSAALVDRHGPLIQAGA